MIPKGKTKFIKSLQLKKYRKAEQCFIVEGEKAVAEVLRSDFKVLMLACTESFFDRYRNEAKMSPDVILTTEKYLVQAGSLQSNEHALAVVKMKSGKTDHSSGGVTVALDDIKDPGNLGTIVRTCDWYGVKEIIASENTADFYSPKVINATMGSFCRVGVNYVSLPEFLAGNRKKVYGAFLEGTSLWDVSFPADVLIVIGSESNGISGAVEPYIDQRITIPRIGHAESLNAAIATGIILDNLVRLKK